MTTCLLCLLEEPSAEEMLRSLLPRILPEAVEVKYMVFEGKQDLEKHLEKRLRGWQRPDSYFLVIRDQDSGDCKVIKQGLCEKVNASGKSARTLIRIACRELESFYLGDLQAVEKGLNLKDISKHQQNHKYRSPDQLANAAEELRKLTKNQYQKKQGSREIAPYLRLDETNTSHSFNVLISGIRKH
ncbi:DUF4276 family protein, partial [Desulfosarcina sp. OttesenSCG-928-B08]|nr:DUF4276 family protein [Desulfosarcina sp. OttesenSCG-928-B08]